MMNKNKVLEGDDQLLWSSDVPLIAYLFQTKVMFLLKITLIYDEPLLIASLHQAATCHEGGRLMTVQL